MRRRARDTSALAAGSAVSGLLAYVFFATATRGLGPQSAAPVAVLWTYWSFSAAVLTFPLQHWIARTVAVHRDESAVKSAMPRLGCVVLIMAGLIGLLSWLVRDALFHRDDWAFPALMALVTVGSGVMGITRGTLTARQQFGSVAAVLVAENALRCLFAAMLVLGDVRDPVVYGAALLAGHLVVVGWPSSLRLRPSVSQVVGNESAFHFLSGASSGQLFAQAALTGGPVLLALGGGTPVEVTAMFAGLALFRAPYTIALGLVSQLTGLLTTWAVHGKPTELARVRLLIVVLSCAGALVAAGVAAAAGPELVRLIFGPGVHLDRIQTMLIAVGSSIALGNLVLTVLVLALGRSAGGLRAWLAATSVAAVFFAIATLSALDRTCWTFVIAQTTAFAVLLTEEARGRARTPTSRPSG